MPEPVCKSATYQFNNLDGFTSTEKYLGDATTTDWVYQGQVLEYDDSVLLTMAPDTVGTVVASSTYMWYGNVSAKFKTSRDAGVVTAFILLSDVHDEIDYEFVGTELTTAQTNYYFQGIPVCKLTCWKLDGITSKNGELIGSHRYQHPKHHSLRHI